MAQARQSCVVIGESRYDEDITDKQIIEEQIGGSTHTNFIQSALLKRHWGGRVMILSCF
jgi:hypothetical protein